MKNLTSFLTAALILLTAASCERIQRSSGESHTLRGKLVQSCEETEGLEGVELGLFLDRGEMPFGGNSGSEYIDRVQTGADGSFELSYEAGIKTNIYLNKIRGQNQSPRLLMMGIPRNKDLDLGLVYHSRPEVDIRFTLDPKFPFSDQDTLSIGGLAGVFRNGSLERREIPGPFSKDQVIVYREGYDGTVQVYQTDSSVLDGDLTLVDPEFIRSIGFYFLGHFEQDNWTSYLTIPCEENEVKVVLDSSLVGN